jgi:maltooligosyltrehalose trehalohydrolase
VKGAPLSGGIPARGNPRLGATHEGENRCHFCVWAPFARQVEVRILAPEEQTVLLTREECGYHQRLVDNVSVGSLYLYRLDGLKERPDPASRYQPRGVHGPSQVIDPCFPWDDDHWSGLRLQDYLFYELHAGTFTPAGTFDAIIPRLDELKKMGITAVELMPIAQFPGDRNWGYDGVYPFSVHNSYGGVEGLKQFINACHHRNLAVVLDVVYNHLGPEGNYLSDFGPYFTDRYRTSWGSAVNFDGPHSDEVRRFFVESALYWITECHVDALRIDAVDAVFDFSAQPFLGELARVVHEEAERLHRSVYLIPESALNDVRIIRPLEQGGFGLDTQWNDDFHHALHVLLTGERSGYYQDFGTVQHLTTAFQEGFVYSGQYSAYRRRRHGSSSRDMPARHFVVFSQNHDQVGNRMLGERLSTLVSFEAAKLAAGAVLLSPYIPLLFMGEEYGEDAPFLYFVSHSDPDLIEAVRKGRKEEFRSFQWKGETPDPQSPETFYQSKLRWEQRGKGNHKVLLDFYRYLIALRREMPALANLDKDNLKVSGREKEKLIFLQRWYNTNHVFGVMSFNTTDTQYYIDPPRGRWKKRIDSSEQRWMGPGATLPERLDRGDTATIKSLSIALYEREEG